ncbi:amidase domain-containing protein [Cohnella nanjingensis]|uniref:Amidase domain-containing protein n=2 Tax=Cohnella nanjingensis TaxID=1387779 RepID=A0A7X0RRB3_9BACL|nr:amidase domain-containing protein [Cohnella nanjingensis]
MIDYVNALNEAGVHGNIEAYRRIADSEHRSRLARRALAVTRRDARERLRPIRSEMRARLLRHTASAKEASADVQIHLLRSYEQRSQPWLEERLEKERIRFFYANGRWRIDRIEPLAGELAAAAVYSYDAEPAEDGYGGRTIAPSVPFINPNAQYAPRSRVYAGSGAAGEEWGGYGIRAAPYRREAAAAYAEQWWDKPNPAYEEFEVNCTNYVSQGLFAGGAPMNYTGKRESGWWYRGQSSGKELWSFSWAVANSLQRHLSLPRGYGLRAVAVNSPDQLMLGDVICYDWDGNDQFRHNTIVTAFTPEGMPLVNANTVPSRHRYWDYRDSYAWTEQTRYRFYHIADHL